MGEIAMAEAGYCSLWPAVWNTYLVSFPFFSPLFLCLCQFRYKKRLYRQTNLDEKQLAKLHTKVSEECLCQLVLSFLWWCLPRSGRFSDSGSSSRQMLGLKRPLRPPEPR